MLRIVGFRSRGPLLGAAILVVALFVLLAAVSFGLLLLAGLTVIGGVTLLARRLFGSRRRPLPVDPPHSGREVFASDERSRRAELPPGEE